MAEEVSGVGKDPEIRGVPEIPEIEIEAEKKKVDSSTPEFWEDLYRRRFMPWDSAGLPHDLEALTADIAAPARMLIPGCGAAYEARYFAEERGFAVTAIDFSEAAVELAAATLAGVEAEIFREDFFALADRAAGRFDLIYERAFLCSLKPKMRPDYLDACRRLLAPGGVLFGFFFVAPNRKGPPFPIPDDELKALFRSGFDLVCECPVEDSLDVFGDDERFFGWRLRSCV